MNTDKSPQDLRLFTEREVQERTGYKHTWIWKSVKAGSFPRPIKHSRSIRFVATEIEAWIRARIADRDGTTTVQRLLFTEREVADALGVSVSLLQKDRITTKRFPFVKVGTSVRYDIDEVRAALKTSPIRGKTAAVEAVA